MAAQNVCRYFKFGFCKFTEMCRFMHITEVCENPRCEIKQCNLRHPRVCKYFRDYNRCKFSEWCAFKHQNNNPGSDELKEIHEELDKLSKAIREKDQIIDDLVDKIRLIEEKLVRKEQLTEESCENDKNFTSIQQSVGFPCEMCDFNAKNNGGLQSHIRAKHNESNENHSVAASVSEPETVIENTAENSEKEHEIQEKSLEYRKFNCSKCKFKTYSDDNLNQHMKRKHTDFTTSFPRNCELCEKSFENVQELKKHMIIHSLEGTTFGDLSCKECNFIGENFETMQVHNGKCCVSEFECGLCYMKADTLVNLETHLASCEVYECEECEKRLTKLSEI